MGRIPAVPAAEAGVLGRMVYRIATRRYGAVPEPFAVVNQHRRLFLAATVAELAYERAVGAVPVALRQLAVYRVATVVGCSWCVDFGAMLQRLDGLDVERLRDIDSYATNARFSTLERRAIAYADAMTAQPMSVTDGQVAELAAELGHAGLVELTHAIALENQRARLNHALGITDQGFDAACRVSQDPGSFSGLAIP